MLDDTGMMLSLKYGNCLTDTVSWKCINIWYDNWYSIDFDDSSWPLAISLQQNKDLNSQLQEFSPTCPIITSEIADDDNIHSRFCRLKLN